MPRPTAAQLAYGSATVVLATLAMLLLSQTRSGIGVAVIAVAALALGLLVAVTVPMPGAAPRVRTAAVQPVASGEPVAVRPVPGVGEPRATEHSLRS
ncbi:hypothetical protein [Streptomyces cavernicola]|uniref:Uncharacterized protein n=1 Tax=Streptomyces cavernicola TaxID=3043613 RepID=A0ABT6SIG8_9ACTN|nr:hypothetical protein [Streptomyces sp. B-S-A6]MDI3407990.1 hypothetical protein [Streptomyces sp. B-S-A6]